MKYLNVVQVVLVVLAMCKPALYLAGPITGESWNGATDWRTQVSLALGAAGIEGISPLRSKEYLLNEVAIADRYDEHILSTSKGIFTRDFYDVSRVDGLFVNFLGAKKVSIGTVMEIAYAWSLRKPIIVVMDKENMHQHSMLRESAGWVVDTIEEGIHVAQNVFL